MALIHNTLIRVPRCFDCSASMVQLLLQQEATDFSCSANRSITRNEFTIYQEDVNRWNKVSKVTAKNINMIGDGWLFLLGFFFYTPDKKKQSDGDAQ